MLSKTLQQQDYQRGIPGTDWRLVFDHVPLMMVYAAVDVPDDGDDDDHVVCHGYARADVQAALLILAVDLRWEQRKETLTLVPESAGSFAVMLTPLVQFVIWN